MSLLFNGDPQHPVGELQTSDVTWWDPPWDNGTGKPGAGGPAIGKGGAIYVDDTNPRVPGRPYWRFVVAPGGQYQTQSGERTLLTRPQNSDFTEGGQPGDTRYYGVSVWLPLDSVAPNHFGLVMQCKMFSPLSPGWSLDTNQAYQLAEGSTPLKLYVTVSSGPLDTAANKYGPGFKYRTGPGWPAAIDPFPLGQWVDLIYGTFYSKGSDGWATLWWKRATDTAWVEVPIVVGDWTLQWDMVNGAVPMSYVSEGYYRGPDTVGHTQETRLAGFYCADNLADIQAMLPSPAPVVTVQSLLDVATSELAQTTASYASMVRRYGSAWWMWPEMSHWYKALIALAQARTVSIWKPDR